jgi:hypothetical protein
MTGELAGNKIVIYIAYMSRSQEVENFTESDSIGARHMPKYNIK